MSGAFIKAVFKKIHFINWQKLVVFGVYFSEFRSTFHGDRGIFSPNVKSNVNF